MNTRHLLIGLATVCLLLVPLLFALDSLVTPLAPVNGSWHNSSEINFTYQSQIAANCTLFIDEVANQTLQTIPETNISLIRNLTDGAHTWAVLCNWTDNSSNITNLTNSTQTLPLSFFVDTLAPLVNITTPENNSLVQGQTVPISLVASDNLAGMLSCNLSWNSTGANSTFLFNATNSTPVQHNLSLGAGNQLLYLTCGDQAGNTGTSSRSLQIMEPAALSISLTAHTFYPGQGGSVTIQANNQSNVTLTITTPTNYTYTSTYLGEAYPKTITLPTNRTGTYQVNATMHYYNTTLFQTQQYDVVSNIDVDIDGDTTIDEGDSVSLVATATGGIPPLQVHWVKEDGSVHLSSIYDRTFSLAGNYDHLVRVTDAAGNVYERPVTIKVRRLYLLSITVKDKDTNAAVPSADLDVDGEIFTTDSNGRKDLLLRSDDYGIRAEKEGYAGIYRSIDLNKNQTLELLLKKQDTSPPGIDLATKDSATLSSDDLIQFTVRDQSTVNCSFYVRDKRDNWYEQQQELKGLDPGQSYTFALNMLDPGEYFWKISCVDEKGNEEETDERSLTLTYPGATVQSSERVNDEDMLQELQDALDAQASFSNEQSQVAGMLQYDQTIQLAVKRIKQIQRDLNTLIYRRDLTQQEIEAQLDNLSKELDAMRATVPVDIKVLNTKNFVKYTPDEALQSLLVLLKDNQEVLNEKNYEARNIQIQSLLLVSSTVANAEITYLDGTTKPITVVSKRITYEEDLPKDLSLLEYIPKDLAQQASDLTILTDHTIMKDDPLIDFGQATDVVYYFNKQVDLDSLEGLETILFDASPPKEMEGVTGGAIISLADTDPKLFLVIGIIIIIAVYIALAFDVRSRIKWFFLRLFTRKQLHYINVLINDSMDYLEQGDYDKAAFIYQEIKLTFDKLSSAGKEKTYDQIMELIHKLDAAYLEELYEKMESHLKINDVPAALQDYHKIEDTYKSLDKENKQRHYTRATELYGRIAPLLQKT